MSELTQREKDLGWCEEAQTYCSIAEDVYKQIRAEVISSICNCNNFPRLYKIYHGIKQRCKNSKSANYKHYGGRGICICEEWDNDFTMFCLWAICNGYNDNLTIDRIDVNGNYEPNNCKWSTKREQANNRNSNTMYEYNGEIHSLSDWALLMGIEHNTIYGRWQKGWRGEELFQPPKKPNNRKDNRMITFNGKTQCMADWSRELGIKQATLSSRINDRGWSIEKAFTTPIAEQLKGQK